MRNLCCAARDGGNPAAVGWLLRNDCTVTVLRKACTFPRKTRGKARKSQSNTPSETQFGKLRCLRAYYGILQPSSLEPSQAKPSQATPKTMSLALPGTTVTQHSILSPVSTLVCCHCNPRSSFLTLLLRLPLPRAKS